MTDKKKSYAGIITAELGNLIKPDLDIKGMSIKKTVITKKLKKMFIDILTEKVLQSNDIDIKDVLNSYDNVAKAIEKSFNEEKSVEFALPKSVGVPDSYKEPQQMEQLRGTLIWNELEPENQIALPDKVNLIKLKPIIDKDDERLNFLKENYPEKYKSVMKVVFGENNKIDISKFGFSVICLPKDVLTIPDYLIPYIDTETMVISNMTNGYDILKSLGIRCETVKTTQFKTNLIEI